MTNQKAQKDAEKTEEKKLPKSLFSEDELVKMFSDCDFDDLRIFYKKCAQHALGNYVAAMDKILERYGIDRNMWREGPGDKIMLFHEKNRNYLPNDDTFIKMPLEAYALMTRLFKII